MGRDHERRTSRRPWADVLHLFSIGEGIACSNGVMNYVVTSSPVSGVRVELADEYHNVEFLPARACATGGKPTAVIVHCTRRCPGHTANACERTFSRKARRWLSPARDRSTSVTSRATLILSASAISR